MQFNGKVPRNGIWNWFNFLIKKKTILTNRSIADNDTFDIIHKWIHSMIVLECLVPNLFNVMRKRNLFIILGEISHLHPYLHFLTSSKDFIILQKLLIRFSTNDSVTTHSTVGKIPYKWFVLVKLWTSWDISKNQLPVDRYF